MRIHHESVILRRLFAALALATAGLAHADQNLPGNVTVTDSGGGHNNLTVTGNLSVNGWIDTDNNSFTFGTQAGGTYGAALLFADSATDSFGFNLNRSSGSWIWSTTNPSFVPAMRLTSAHQLVLYQSDGTTAGITLTPATNSIGLGTATLTASGTAITTNGALTVGGAFSAPNYTASSGTITGGSTGLALAAGGTNQNISLTPSGTGVIALMGTVGVATTTPVQKLTIAGANSAPGTSGTAADGVLRIGSSGTNLALDAGVSGGGTPFAWLQARNATTYASNYNLALNPNGGNVGIGTTAPAFRLHVVSAADTVAMLDNATSNNAYLDFRAGSTLDATGELSFNRTAANTGDWYYGGNAVGSHYWRSNAYGIKMALSPSGFLGIGTSTPQSELHIYSANAYSPEIQLESVGNTGASYLVLNKARVGKTAIQQGDGLGTLLFTGFAGGGYQQSSYITAIADAAPSGTNVYSALQFISNHPGGSTYENLRITSSGNIGVGTTTPVARVSINGGGTVDPLQLSDGTRSFRVGPSVGASQGFNIYDDTAASVRLRIDNSGNVGIGSSSPDAKLALRGDNMEISLGRGTVDGNGYGRIGFDTNFNQYLASNATWTGSAWNYVTTAGYGGVATRFLNSNGAFEFDTASGGVNPVPWSPRLYINNSGNVGIGTTAPASTLQVAGTITAGQGGSTSGVDLIYGNYGNGKLFVVGSQYSTGASFLGYGVKASPGAAGYLSSTTIGVGRASVEANMGYISFLTGATQTSTDGGAVTLAEAMRVTSSGNVGVGITAPLSKLSVNGQVGVHSGAIFTEPQGDLSMGSFTSGTQPSQF